MRVAETKALQEDIGRVEARCLPVRRPIEIDYMSLATESEDSQVFTANATSLDHLASVFGYPPAACNSPPRSALP